MATTWNIGDRVSFLAYVRGVRPDGEVVVFDRRERHEGEVKLVRGKTLVISYTPKTVRIDEKNVAGNVNTNTTTCEMEFLVARDGVKKL